MRLWCLCSHERAVHAHDPKQPYACVAPGCACTAFQGRDPRQDPIAGDRLGYFPFSDKPLMRTVIGWRRYMDGPKQVARIVYRPNESTKTRECSRAAWRQWATGATTYARGETATPAPSAGGS